jgi:DNA-binding response OmpR family regulator
MSGWEFLEKLRVEYGKREIPVIIFSASPLVDDTIAHLNDSRLGVLKKPVSLSELSEGIKKFLG